MFSLLDLVIEAGEVKVSLQEVSVASWQVEVKVTKRRETKVSFSQLKI